MGRIMVRATSADIRAQCRHDVSKIVHRLVGQHRPARLVNLVGLLFN